MRALIKKNVIESKWTIIVFLLYIGVFGIFQGRFALMYVLAFALTILSNTVIRDKKSGWNNFELMIPVSDMDIVRAKFKYSAIFIALNIFTVYLMQIVGDKVLNLKQFVYITDIRLYIVFYLATFIINNIQIMFVYIVGIENIKYVNATFVFIIFVVLSQNINLIFLNNKNLILDSPISKMLFTMPAIIILSIITIAINFLAIRVSAYFYRKKLV